MFTKLYLDTTNSLLEFNELLQLDILIPLVISTLFHTIIYAIIINIGNWILFENFLSKQVNTRLLIILIVIMFFGFFARYFHVKDIYKTYNNDIVKTRNHLDQLYISWLFIS